MKTLFEKEATWNSAMAFKLVKQETDTAMRIGHVEHRKLRRQTNLNWKLIITYVRKK